MSNKKKIKSTTLMKFDYVIEDVVAEEIEIKGAKYSYTEFDEQGNLLLEVKYNKNGGVEEKYENKFNDLGQLVEEIIYLPDDEVAQHKTFEYNNEGSIAKAHKHYQDGSKDTVTSRYEHGKLVEKITTDSDDEVEAKEEFVYKDSHLVSRKVYEYDELVSDESFDYDESGNLIEQTKWTTDDQDSKYYNHFNEKGNLIKTLTSNIKDELLAKNEYFYDEEGLLEKINEESIHGKNTTLLEYDEHKNSIRQVEINQQGDFNNEALRMYNENNDVVESEVMVNLHGMGINQHYILKYEYEYFDS